ncbi:MAG TPA: DUF1501 domain-containing protein [Planctomycetota bacterium]|nr:DUF1501 domain-containing protein [Planctomycetota bacterium]
MVIDVNQGSYCSCDGVSRRNFLKAGALAFGGLTLADMFRHQAKAAEGGASIDKDMSVILIWQGGGPSHLDMWDLKPQAPSEFRGTFNPIKTNLPGYQVCEHMPKIAQVCDKLTIIRSCTHPDSGHESASHMLLTGYKPTNDIPANEVPSYGSIVSKELGPKQPGFPAYVSVPTAPRSSAAAYLGVAYNPFETHGDPNNKDFRVRNLKAASGISMERLENRRALLKQFDKLRRDADSSGVIEGMDAFSEQAFELVTSPKVQEAFDLSKEKDELRDKYGRTTWGQSVLLSRRLVESGVRFVTMNMGGWDTHNNNFEDLKRKLPNFDQSFSALIQDLHDRGRLDKTMVLVWGEFGRTPRINATAGRDHWSNVFTVVMAGGGLKKGVVLGQSDARAEFPKERPVSPQDVLATMYHKLGINREKTYNNEADRPMEILNLGAPIPEII